MTDVDPYAEFVERAASEFITQGFPRMPAYVMMALTGSEEGRMTAAELAERLSVSPAAISGAIRYLITVGFVRQSSMPGSRRHLYALAEEAWYTGSLTRYGLYRQFDELLHRLSEPMKEGSAARTRIEEMADFFGFLDERLPGLLQEWEQRRAAGPR